MENSQNYQYNRANLTHKKTEPYEVIIAIVLPLIGISISFMYNYIGSALVIAGLWIFVKHFLGKSTIISRLLPDQHLSLKLLSYNKTTEVQKNILLLLPEIFYKSKLSSNIEKLYIKYFYIYTISTVLSIFWLYSKIYMPSMSIFLIGNLILFVLHVIFFFLYSFVQSKLKVHSLVLTQPIINYFNQTNDINNLHILIKPENAQHCMNDFIEQNSQRFNRANTVVVNLSPYCSQYNNVIMEEGMLVMNEYFEYQNTIQKLNLMTTTNRYYLSDLLPFKANDFFGISFACSSEVDYRSDLHKLLKDIVIGD